MSRPTDPQTFSANHLVPLFPITNANDIEPALQFSEHVPRVEEAPPQEVVRASTFGLSDDGINAGVNTPSV